MYHRNQPTSSYDDAIEVIFPVFFSSQHGTLGIYV